MTPPELTRVLIASRGIFPLQIGGIQRHTRQLAERLAAEGVEVDVLTPAFAGVEPLTDVPFRHRLGAWVESSFAARSLAAYGKEVAAAARDGYDAVLGQGFSLWHAIDRPATALLHHPHGLEHFKVRGAGPTLRSLTYRRRSRAIARSAHVTCSLGPQLDRELQQFLHIGREKISFFPNFTDVERVRAHAHGAREDGLLVFCGRLVDYKGLDVLFEAMRGADVAGRLVVVGDGPLLRTLRADARGLPVEFTGTLADAALHELLSRADAFVFPSRNEGQGVAVLEAMAAGLPIVASDVGEITETVEPGTGIVVPPGDAEALRAALSQLFRLAPSERRAMGERATDVVRRRYSWEAARPAILAAFARARERFSSQQR